MINKQWMRAGVGACGVASLVLGAGLMFAPAANAAPSAGPTAQSSDLLGGTVTTVGGIVNGVLTPSPTASAPITVGSNGGLTVGVNSTTVTVGTGTNGAVGVGVTGTGGTGIGVNLGTTSTGTTVNGGTSTGTNGSNGSDGTNGSNGSSTSTSTSTNTNTSTGSNTGTGTPVMLTALSVTAQYPTVYPAKDGYRDTVAFQLKGTASDGQQHAANGTATLTFGSSTVTTWPITATDNAITWNGLKGGKIVPGRYVLSAVIGDSAGHTVTGTAAVDVSAKKLAATSTTYTTKSVSGTHKMAAKPLAGLSKAKVTLRVITKVSGIKGKQYLVFKHAGKKIKVLIRNGKHTSKSVTIPKSFTSYTISHTWKTKAVKIRSLKYKYSYKALK